MFILIRLEIFARNLENVRRDELINRFGKIKLNPENLSLRSNEYRDKKI